MLIMSLNNFDREHLGQLLEWSPTVVVNDKVYKQAEDLGIKIDAIVSADLNFRLLHHTHFIITEEAPLEDALKFLVGEQYHAVNIISPNFVLKDYALFAEHINLVIFTGKKKIFSIKSGFSKWQTKGQKVDLMHEVSDLHTSGLKAIDKHHFETEKDGFYSLSFDNPFIFIAENV